MAKPYAEATAAERYHYDNEHPRCPLCGSFNIQEQWWYRPSTHSVIDPTEGYSWCQDCNEPDGLDYARGYDWIYCLDVTTVEVTR